MISSLLSSDYRRWTRCLFRVLLKLTAIFLLSALLLIAIIASFRLAHNQDYKVRLLPQLDAIIDKGLAANTDSHIALALHQAIKENLPKENSDIAEKTLRSLIEKNIRYYYSAALPPPEEAPNILERLCVLGSLYASDAISDQLLKDAANAQIHRLDALHPVLLSVMHIALYARSDVLNSEWARPYIQRVQQVIASWYAQPYRFELLNTRKELPDFDKDGWYQPSRYSYDALLRYYQHLKPNWDSTKKLMDVLPDRHTNSFAFERMTALMKRLNKDGYSSQDISHIVQLDYRLQLQLYTFVRRVNLETVIFMYEQLPEEVRSGVSIWLFGDLLSQLANLALHSYSQKHIEYPDYQRYLREVFFPLIIDTAQKANIPLLDYMSVFVISGNNTPNINSYNDDIKQTRNQILFTYAIEVLESIGSDIPLHELVSHFIAAQKKSTLWLERTVALVRQFVMGENILYGSGFVSVFELPRLETLTYGITDVESEVLAHAIMAWPESFSAQQIRLSRAILQQVGRADRVRSDIPALVRRYVHEYGSDFDIFIDPAVGQYQKNHAWNMIGYPRWWPPLEKWYQFNYLWRYLTMYYSPYVDSRPKADNFLIAYRVALGSLQSEFEDIFSENPERARELFMADQLDNPDFYTALLNKDMSDTQKTLELLRIQNKVEELRKERKYISPLALELFYELTRDNQDIDLPLQLKLVAGYHRVALKKAQDVFESRLKKLSISAPDPKQLSTLRFYSIAVVALREVATMHSLTQENNYPRLAMGADLVYNWDQSLNDLYDLWEVLWKRGLLDKENPYDFDIFMGYLMMLSDYKNQGFFYINDRDYAILKPYAYKVLPDYYSSMMRIHDGLKRTWNKGSFIAFVNKRNNGEMIFCTPGNFVVH